MQWYKVIYTNRGEVKEKNVRANSVAQAREKCSAIGRVISVEYIQKGKRCSK